jgi:hypothetical protein
MGDRELQFVPAFNIYRALNSMGVPLLPYLG